jgi:hypothetical protein
MLSSLQSNTLFYLGILFRSQETHFTAHYTDTRHDTDSNRCERALAHEEQEVSDKKMAEVATHSHLDMSNPWSQNCLSNSDDFLTYVPPKGMEMRKTGRGCTHDLGKKEEEYFIF